MSAGASNLFSPSSAVHESIGYVGLVLVDGISSGVEGHVGNIGKLKAAYASKRLESVSYCVRTWNEEWVEAHPPPIPTFWTDWSSVDRIEPF